MKKISTKEQGVAIARLQRSVWSLVVERFNQLQAQKGLRQSDLAWALGISRPQIHEWLSDPSNMTLKAAGRLLRVMDAEIDCVLDAEPEVSSPLSGGASSEPQNDAGDKRIISPLVLTGIGLVALTLMGDPACAGAPNVRPLAGGQAAKPLSGPAVVLFWRADCGPCLLELRNLAALRAAAAPTPVYTVSLDAPEIAQAKLRRWGVEDPRALSAVGEPTAVLTAAAGGAPRLPLSVVYGAEGQVCARHVGLLGTDRAGAWSRSC